MTGLILPRQLETKPRYDLNTYHARLDRGGIVLWVTWDRITGRPCMILTRNIARISHERIIPCVVPLDRAWMWDERTGDDHECNVTCGIFAPNLGLSPFEVRDVFAIKSLIRNHLHDLITCPPLPAEDKETAADALITDNATGTVTHKEIKDHA